MKKENVQDKVTLFYNDYDTYFSVDDELALISYINEGEESKNLWRHRYAEPRGY